MRDLEFSSDGRFLATLTSDGSLYVNDTRSRDLVYSLRGEIKGNDIAWRPGKHQLAVALDQGQGWDIWLLDLEGRRQRLTRHPGRESSPQWIDDGKTLVFVSNRREDADLYELALDDPRSQPEPFVARPHDQWRPRARPHGDAVAYLSRETGQTDLWLAAEGQEPYRIGSLDPQHRLSGDDYFSWDRSGRALIYVEQGAGGNKLHEFNIETRKDTVLLQRDRIDNPLLDSTKGWLLFGSEKGMALQRLKGFHPFGLGHSQTLTLNGLALGHPALGERGEETLAAFEVEGRASCVGLAPADDLEFLYFEPSDHLFYAERFYRVDRPRSAEGLYRFLDEHLKSADDVMAAGIHHASQLRRSDHPRRALSGLGRLEQTLPPGTDLSRLYALQGELFFYELQDFEKAQLLFHMAETLAPGSDGEAPEPLEILKSNRMDLIRLYAEAHAALRRGDIGQCVKTMDRLARLDPGNPTIQSAILDLLDNPYEKESVVPEQNPFQDARQLDGVIDTLQRLTNAATSGSPQDRETQRDQRRAIIERLRQQLLQALLHAKRFAQARKLVPDILKSDGLEGLGTLDFLHYYVETDRRDLSADEFLGQVLLASSVAPEIEPRLKGNVTGQALLVLARIKLALQQGDLNTASSLLMAGYKAFESSWGTKTGEATRLRFYLFFYQARICEREEQWDKAVQSYRTAIALASNYSPERTDLLQDLRVAQMEVEHGKATPQHLRRLLAIQRSVGAELFNPTNDPQEIRAGVTSLLELLRSSSPSPLDTFILFQIGRTLGHGENPAAAIHYLDRALQANPPNGLRVAILWEKAAVLQDTEDWWGQQNVYLAMLLLPIARAQQEAAQLNLATTCLHLGQVADGRRILQALSDGATVQVFRESAGRQLQEVDTGTNGVNRDKRGEDD